MDSMAEPLGAAVGVTISFPEPTSPAGPSHLCIARELIWLLSERH